MKLLLVEDDENKRIQLSQFLVEAFSGIELFTARSLQSGLRHVRRQACDLIILDMTLPNYDTSPEEPGGQMYPFGGQEFLRQMDRFDIHIPAVVVTQFETFGTPEDSMDLKELDSRLRTDHSEVYVGFVYYNAAISGWKHDLKTILEPFFSSRRG